MRKRLLSALLALFLTLALLPTTALAANSDFVIENGVLTKYNGSGGKVTIPDGVTRIGKRAFWCCYSLTGVTIPNSVTIIGEDAFANCASLTSVTIPNSVTSLGYEAFQNCSSLTSVTIPNSVISIGDSAFSGCGSLTSVTIPNSVTSIGRWVFSDCASLTRVTIPSSVTSIGESAFLRCGSLTSVTIPNSVTSIGESAFHSCDSLTRVTIPNSVTTIGAWAFSECDRLTSVTIPNSVTSIERGAFYGCDSLTIVTIPGSVTSIGKEAFGFCASLTAIQVETNNRRYFSTYGIVFSKDKTLTAYPGGKRGAYSIPNSVTSIGEGAFCGCDSLTSVTIPDSVTSIGDDAFAFCSNLTSVTIPSSVISIGDSAFLDCSSLTGVTIPNSVTSIGDSAFFGCESLSGVTIPYGVTSIGGGTFRHCYGLASVAIPSSVTSIGAGAFYWCASLTNVYYGGTEAQWKRVTIGEDNDELLSAAIHYNSTWIEPNKDISKITINGKSIQSLFSRSSFEYDNDLALFAAGLSEAAEDETGDRIEEYYRSLGWPDADWDIYQYGGDRAYSIACAKLSRDENLLVITARGSQTPTEFFEDGFSFGKRDFFGYETNDVISDFDRDIMTGLNKFLTNHRYLEEEPLKVLITGHSLGGAAANLNAARFTLFKDYGAWWTDLTEQSDIYCYTFGAINSLSDNSTVEKGFENIHNIYNLEDSFGPNRWGNKLPSGLGRGYGKFGHMDVYSHDYEGGDDDQNFFFVNTTNHLIEQYIDSLTEKYVSCSLNSPVEPKPGQIPLDDVEAGKWYYDAVYWAVQNGVTNGTSATTFSPDQDCTEIQILTFLWRAAGKPAADAALPVNVTGVADYVSAAKWAFSKGMIDASLKQDTPCTRARAVMLMWQAAGSPAASGSGFADVPENAAYAQAVSWAVGEGITNGTGKNTFSPGGICSRGHIVTFLYRDRG